MDLYTPDKSDLTIRKIRRHQRCADYMTRCARRCDATAEEAKERLNAIASDPFLDILGRDADTRCDLACLGVVLETRREEIRLNSIISANERLAIGYRKHATNYGNAVQDLCRQFD